MSKTLPLIFSVCLIPCDYSTTILPGLHQQSILLIINKALHNMDPYNLSDLLHPLLHYIFIMKTHVLLFPFWHCIHQCQSFGLATQRHDCYINDSLSKLDCYVPLRYVAQVWTLSTRVAWWSRGYHCWRKKVFGINPGHAQAFLCGVCMFFSTTFDWTLWIIDKNIGSSLGTTITSEKLGNVRFQLMKRIRWEWTSYFFMFSVSHCLFYIWQWISVNYISSPLRVRGKSFSICSLVTC